MTHVSQYKAGLSSRIYIVNVFLYFYQQFFLTQLYLF